MSPVNSQIYRILLQEAEGFLELDIENRFILATWIGHIYKKKKLKLQA